MFTYTFYYNNMLVKTTEFFCRACNSMIKFKIFVGTSIYLTKSLCKTIIDLLTV